MIKTGVVGACGKMGQEVVKLVLNSPDLELVLAVDKFKTGEKIKDNVIIKDDLLNSINEAKPDIVVDFTQPSVIFENIKIYQKTKTKAVIGTTGLSSEQIDEIKKMSKENNTGIIIAPNFSIGAILRLEIGLSYFAMLVMSTLLTTYFAFSIFENIRANKYLDSNNYEMAITTAMKQNRTRFAVLACAVALIGLLFILFAPNPIRFVSVNIMFMAVVLLAVSYYVVPFVWSALITHMRKKKVVVKSTEK